MKKINHLGVFRNLGNRAFALLRGRRKPGTKNIWDAAQEVHVVRRTETTVEREWISIRTEPSYTDKNIPAEPSHESHVIASHDQIAGHDPASRPPEGKEI